MTDQLYRLPAGGRINRQSLLNFTFNGQSYQGYEGDTLASALLANGVHLVGRSFKYHRPRGIYTCGPEEPNALVQMGDCPAQTDPNTRATQIELFEGLQARSQNCWPTVRYDFGAFADRLSGLLSAGFYYKTFMQSPKWWHFCEKFIRKAAGMGISPMGFDPDRYERQYAHTDILIIGSGPAGLAAALTAARGGAEVMLVDEQPELGGSLLSEPHNARLIGDMNVLEWRHQVLEELRQYKTVTLMPRTTAFGYYHQDFVCLLERITDHIPYEKRHSEKPRQKFWQLRAAQTVLATGAIERPLIFSNNDRPGIMLVDAVRSYLNRYAVMAGTRIVIVTNNDSAYLAAFDIQASKSQVVAIVDTRQTIAPELAKKAQTEGIDLYLGYAVIGTKGRHRIKQLSIKPLTDDRQHVHGKRVDIHCDLVAHSGGWNPTLHLFSHHLGTVQWDDEACTVIPELTDQPIWPAGRCTGLSLLEERLISGEKQAKKALQALHYKPPTSKSWRVEESQFTQLDDCWMLPSDKPLEEQKAFVDIQNDVTVKDLHLAVQEGYTQPEHVKRYTTTGMGTDQGKTSGVNALTVIADMQAKPRVQFKPTTYRPPYTPTTIGAIAGRHIGRQRYHPNRVTPMHSWHLERGAVFENVGQWWRPRYYPQGDETMHDAVQRECRTARTKAAILDATTLGKIDIQGVDAPEFLNRVYTNGWKKLKVGRCRYGIMLGEDGMVIDDGVTARLAEDHYQMSTTTGGAAKVFAWLERWLQTEWPDLDVYLTSVTEQWAVLSICGPNSYDIVAQITQDIDVDPEKLPFMAVRDAHVKLPSGDVIPARIFRISFTGELSYEINVPASYGLTMWRHVFDIGENYGLTPYGTEGMHLMRAEKGFILVGQETDGTVTPYDLDMDWIVRTQKNDFIGKRSLYQTDLQRENRKQLVGLLTEDPNVVLEEGRHVIETAQIPSSPVPMLGHVSSSYYSPNLKRSIALALIKGGKQREGERLYVAYPEANRTVPVQVTTKEFL